MTPVPVEALRCVIIGAGGHARVILDALRASQRALDCVFVEVDNSQIGSQIDGVPIVGDDDVLVTFAGEGRTRFAVGVGGDNRIRRRLFDRALAARLLPLSVAHPASVRSARAEIAEGCQLFAGSIVNPGAVLGANVIVNTGAIVEHDCTIEPHAHIATGARLTGGVWIGEGAHIGAGATIRPGTRIGAWAVVGAGAVVTKDVAANLVVAGVPARPMRTLPTQETT